MRGSLKFFDLQKAIKQLSWKHKIHKRQLDSAQIYGDS